MNFLAQRLPVLSYVVFPACITLAVAIGCGGDDANGGGAAANDGGTPSSNEAGTTPSSGGDGGDGNNPGGTFWYMARQSQAIGVSDLAGADVFQETVDDGQLQSLAIGAGSAWVMTKSGNLRRYDQSTHALITTIQAVAKNPSRLVFAAGSVWIAEDNDDSTCEDATHGPAKLLRLDPATNTVTTKIPVTATTDFPCNRFDDLKTDGTALYALINNSFGIARIDPASNTVTKNTPLGTGGGFGTGYLAVGSGTVWVHNTDAKTIIALDPTSLAVKTTTPMLDYLGEQMIATGAAVIMDKPGTSVLHVDAADPTKQVEVTFADSPDAFVTHAGVVYATVRHDLTAVLVTLDEGTLAEKGRVELPPLTGIDEVAFLP